MTTIDPLASLAMLLVHASEALLTETDADVDRQRWLRSRLDDAATEVRNHIYGQST